MSDQATKDALLTLAFSIKSNPGAYALLIGAGVSAGSGVMTAWGVLEDLVGSAARQAGADENALADPVAWWKDTYGEEPQYETLLEKLAPTSVERQKLLSGYFEPTSEDVESGQKAPTPAHHAIARLAKTGFVRVIVTLNFDRLIEKALRAANVEPTVIASPADVEGMAPLHTIACCVIHLHGDYLNPTSMRNTTSELAAYEPGTVALLNKILQDYGLIIAGWSSKYDPVLRAAIAAQYPARLTMAWIEPGPVSDRAAELRTLKKGLLVASGANTAFGQLSDAVESLAQRNAAHPLTVPVAIGTAKRELAGRTVAIGLHDTLNKELGQLLDHPDFHLRSYQSDAPYGGYSVMLGRVEEASRMSCALVAALAYWGNRTTDCWWIEEVHRFTTRPRTGGMTALLGLRLVAGSALMYSAGVAAAAGQRSDVLARLFAISGPDPYSANRPLDAETLNPARTYAVRDGATRHFALVMPLLREAVAVNDDALDDAWQRFEILRSCAIMMRLPRFSKRLNDFIATENRLAMAQEAYDVAERNGAGAGEARATRALAVEDRGRRLGHLADLVHLGPVHLFAATGPDGGHRIPIAERLAEDVAAETEQHPLVVAGIASDSAALKAALLAVSVAGGRQASQMAWERVPPSGGIVVDEIWLDTGKTPDEVRHEMDEATTTD